MRLLVNNPYEEWTDVSEYDSIEDFVEFHGSSEIFGYVAIEEESVLLRFLYTETTGYKEYRVTPELFQVVKYLEKRGIDLEVERDLVWVYNEACSEYGTYEDAIHPDLDIILENIKPYAAFQLGQQANFKGPRNFYRIRSGFLEGTDVPVKWVDEEVLFQYLKNKI